jgi:hypothetical protein
MRRQPPNRSPVPNPNMDSQDSKIKDTPKPNPDASPCSPQDRQDAYVEKLRELEAAGLKEEKLDAELYKWMDSLKGSKLCPAPSMSPDSSPQERKWALDEKKLEWKAEGLEGDDLAAEIDKWTMDSEWYKGLDALVNADLERLMGRQFEKTMGDGFEAWVRK